MHERSTATAAASSRGDRGHPVAALKRVSPVIDVHYRRIRALLWTVTLSVLALGIFREVWIELYGRRTLLGKMPLINLDSENALGEWWSVLQLLIAAALLAANGLADPDRRWKPYWFALAALFVFLSIDESIGIHESLMPLMVPYKLSGFFSYAWIVPYGIASIVIGLVFLRFVSALPSHIRWRVVVAGGLYLVAVLGVEGLAGYCITGGGAKPIQFKRPCQAIAYVTEESGETIAVTLFILALLLILAERCRTLTFRF